MPFTLRPTTPRDYEAVVALCRTAMRAPADAPFLERRHMEWKCWREHPWTEGSRGYVVEKDGELAAHGCAWPVFVRRGGQTLPGFNLIDWAASDRFPGAGLILLQRLLRETPRMYNIGGTDDTTAVLPRLGFHETNEHHLLAKPLRPLRQALTHPRRDWKLPARALRNVGWSLSGDGSVPAGWDAVRVEDVGRAPEAWWIADPPNGAGLRSPDWYRYILSSPLVPFELYDLRCGGDSRGFFCLSRCPGQARLADYRLLDPAHDAAWQALAALTRLRALDDAASAELTAWTSDEPLRRALLRAGFHALRSDPVRCNREEYAATGGAPYLFTGLDSDFAFLHAARPDYAS